ncbi:enoyl-CoA hydratase/isomerase family protein [Spirillospora sp. NPDC048819]|uniref:enoyl-CoA hydratase/isomerase family protein n=1 Tax=Spirillospora sp. NPDC048819 TaxID=3155268 RepID=UPI0033C68887
MRDDVAWVRLNRMDYSNAIDDQAAIELRSAWAWLREEPGISTIVITGNGPEAFSVGLSSRSRPSDPSFTPRVHGVRQQIIAAVNGIVIGEAFALLDDADMIIAAEHATFVQPVRPMPAAPGAGRSRWFDGADWSTPMRADQARAAGLVHEVCPLVELKQVTWRAAAAVRTSG